MNNLPTAKSQLKPTDRDRARRIIAERNLTGLANDTKWNELITEVRNREDWRPRYRFKSIEGAISEWDCEWFYHLPFPFIVVEWLDISTIHTKHIGALLSPAIIDEHTRLVGIVQRIGLDFKEGKDVIRIFGYGPRNLDLFEN